MKDMRQFFAFLNDVNFEYVVLRNWDNLPNSVELGEHSDLDLLVYDLDHFLEIIKEAKPEYPLPRVRFKIPIGDMYIYADIRHVGDGYYPSDFQKAILETREWNPAGFWTPNPIHHRIALAYHAVHHKNQNRYERWLGPSSPVELLGALKDSSIGWCPPSDPTVGRFHAYWTGATAVVTRLKHGVRKKQTGYMEYDLIFNEYRILKELNNRHFPKVYAYCIEESYLDIEDCGERLTASNAPADWERQCIEIVTALRESKVTHRDIRPENIMVKNGVLKLIDFGWATMEGDLNMEAPECLGFPYRPSEGFSDAFSMKKVMKIISYLMEEVNENTRA